MSPPTASVERRLGVATLIMTGGVLLSRVTGHLREMIIVALYGAGRETDAYYAAFTLPDLLNYMLAGGALSIAFMPIFTSYLAEGREAEGWRIFSVVATTMSGILLLLVLAGELAAASIVPWLVPGFPPEQLEQVVRLTRIVMPAQLAFYLGGLVQATLYAKEQFLAPAISPLVYNVVTIAGGLLLRPLGVEGFAWGVLIGAFLGPLLLPLLAARKTLRYRLCLSVRDPGMVRFVVLSLPLMIGVSLLTVDQWIARYFASGMEGSITHLENARRLMLVPTAVLGQAAGMAALPFLARLEASGQRAEMGRVLGLAMRGVLEVTLLAGLWIAAVAGPIVLLVFGWGRNTFADVQQTALLLMIFAVGIPAWGIQGVAVRGFYARQDTLTPMLVSSLVVAAMLPVYWALARFSGAPGLAAATSLGMAVTTLVTLLALKIRGVAVEWASLLSTLLRGGLAALLAGAGAWGGSALLQVRYSWHEPWWAAVHLVVSAVIFGALILLLAPVLKLSGTLLLVGKLRQRVGRRRTT